MRPLAGRRVVTTRERAGRLDSLLAAAGADVVHVPLIRVTDPTDGGAALRTALEHHDDIDWLVVTSPRGAERVGRAAAGRTELRLAAVGARTAEVLASLAGRPVDVVPERQTAVDLVDAMRAHRGRVLIAQADRAESALADGLAAAGFDPVVVTAYSTELRRPSARERQAAVTADAVAFASGSSVEAWVDAIGSVAPPIVVVIGPSTAAAANHSGLQPTHIAADHDVDGLATAVTAAFAD